jgi:hypothetical protein
VRTLIVPQHSTWCVRPQEDEQLRPAHMYKHVCAHRLNTVHLCLRRLLQHGSLRQRPGGGAHGQSGEGIHCVCVATDLCSVSAHPADGLVDATWPLTHVVAQPMLHP